MKCCIAAPRLSAGTSLRSAWYPTLQQHARLCISLTEDALDMWMRNERVHQALFTTNSEDVDVAACLPSTPQAADRDQLDVAVVHAQELDE